MTEKQTLVKVEHLSKKFCRKLKRSLWYGIQDIGAELLGSKKERTTLRKEEFWALKDLNFEIKQGELVGLIGPNGAGKTTLLKVLSGLVKPDIGQVTIRGKIQALIALGAGFNPILTARENIYINGAVLGFSKKKMDHLIEEIMDFAEIGEFIDMPVQSYSSGMQVRLGFAVAVNLKPDILIVDEVLAVGDASFRRKARQKMMELLHSGISVLFVSHNMSLISSLTSRCIYIDKGEMISIGPSDQVTSLYLAESLKRAQAAQENIQSENPLMASAYVTVPESFVLKNVFTSNVDELPNSDFNTYDNIRISLEMVFPKKIENIMLGISIRDQVDDVVISSSKLQLNSHAYKGQVTAVCEIESNKFREGNYNIGCYVSDFEGGSLYKSHCVGTFTILPNMEIIQQGDSTRGFVVLDTHWKVSES